MGIIKRALEALKRPFTLKPIRKGIAFTKKVVKKLSGDNLLPGERHGLLLLPNGDYSRANYMGPGTNLAVRIPRGDRGLSAVDRIAKAHDIRYALASSERDTQVADAKMIRAVQSIERKGKDRGFNIAQAKLIKVKHKLGIPTKWITTFGGTPEAMRGRFKSALAPLARKGY